MDTAGRQVLFTALT